MFTSYQEVTKKFKCLLSLSTKSPALLSLQAGTSIIMGGMKTCIVFGGILVALVSGKCILLFQFCLILTCFFFVFCISNVFKMRFSSYLRTVATNHCVERGRVHPAAQLFVQHKLYRQKKRGLGGTPAPKHLCPPRILHGNAFHLQRHCGTHPILHVRLWKPWDWGTERVRRRRDGNICLCPRWAMLYSHGNVMGLPCRETCKLSCRDLSFSCRRSRNVLNWSSCTELLKKTCCSHF